MRLVRGPRPKEMKINDRTWELPVFIEWSMGSEKEEGREK